MHRFNHAAGLHDAAALQVAQWLLQALAGQPRATLVVSGGRTPIAVWRRLRQATLDWQRVDIVLADERWVPPEHPDSNGGMVQQHLLQGPAAQARWWPLYLPDTALCDAVPHHNQVLPAALGWPADVVMLGMGLDGHTASWFPGMALPEGEADWCAATPVPPAPNVQQARLTLTPRALLDARHVMLLVEGADKEPMLARAMVPPAHDAASLPVQLACWASPAGCDVFYSS